MPTKSKLKKKEIIAWAIINSDDNNILANWSITYAIFPTKRKAQMFLRSAEVEKPKVIKVKIIPIK